ncbi:hypothetical protein C8R46DRAFT_1026637 [Mycena filopes]|nr:hypothetical protein C8R46DRAFT_1026637 [Mycena filopes]
MTRPSGAAQGLPLRRTGPINIIGPPGSADNPVMVHPSPPRPQQRPPVRTVGSVRVARQSNGTSVRRPRRISASAIAPGQPYPPGLLGDTARLRSASVTRRELLTAGNALHLDIARELGARLIAPGPRQRSGLRDKRAVPLNVDNVLLTSVAPPAKVTDRSHQTCGICLHIKSHPVSYLCGHSHCYRCIRVWLEKKFSCPTCRAIMYQKPHRNYIEEEGLAVDHPTFNDLSLVDYNFDGLRFPQSL